MKTFSEFQEGVAAFTLKRGSKLLPKLMVATGLLGTLMQAKRKYKTRNNPLGGTKGKRTISDREKKLTDRLNKQNINQRTGGETFDTKGLKKGSKLITPKKGQVIQDEFSAPTNSTGPAVPGTGDDSSTVVVKKSSMLRRKNYAKGGRNSRKPWLDHLKNK